MLFAYHDLILRVIASLILIFWVVYWILNERSTNKAKPKHTLHKSLYLSAKYTIQNLFKLVLLLQLLGLDIFTIYASASTLFILKMSGFFLILLGAYTAVSARKRIGNNWTHAFEYQIKHNQQLVTNGIYAYIRHPIYAGLLMAFVGIELLVESYLVFVSLILFVLTYYQLKQEEVLLLKHFGNRYEIYKQKSKMLIPFLW